MNEKLEYKPTKIHPVLLKRIDKDVARGVFVNFNTAINEILMLHYQVKFEKKIRLKDLRADDKFVFVYNLQNDERVWIAAGACRGSKRLCLSDGKEEYKDCNSVVYKIEE
jgi:hypothetical protein